MDWLTLLGLWCTALSVAFIWPQVVRVYRQHTVEGIAPKGTLHGATASAFWMLYGLAVGDAAITLANVAVVLAMALIAFQQVRHGTLPARTGILTAVLVAVVGVGATLLSPTAIGWLAIVAGATSVLPQTVHVLRSETLNGVSITTYLLLCLTAFSWAAYGVFVGDPLVIITNVLVLPCAAVVAARAWLSQRGTDRALVEDSAYA